LPDAKAAVAGVLTHVDDLRPFGVIWREAAMLVIAACGMLQWITGRTV